MSKRCYKKGEPITSVEELMQQEFIIVCYGKDNKTTHISVVLSWQLRLVDTFIRRGRIFKAIKLTNREYYKRNSYDYFMYYYFEPCKNCLFGIRKDSVPILCNGCTVSHDAYNKWLDAPIKTRKEREYEILTHN